MGKWIITPIAARENLDRQNHICSPPNLSYNTPGMVWECDCTQWWLFSRVGHWVRTSFDTLAYQS